MENRSAPETKPMVTPVEAVQGFRKYADFGGRATRAEYWWWVLFLGISGFILGIIDALIGAGGRAGLGAAWHTVHPGNPAAQHRRYRPPFA